jgi:hypothetical protein
MSIAEQKKVHKGKLVGKTDQVIMAEKLESDKSLHTPFKDFSMG